MEFSNLWVDYVIRRSPVSPENKLRKSIGFLMTVKARPELEKYMENLSGGRTIGVEAYANLWTPVDNKPLSVYVISEGLNTRVYSFAYAGNVLLPNLVTDARLRSLPSDEDLVNLSFLALEGISKPEGVTFGVEGAYSADYIKKLRNLLPVATKQFLSDFIVPMTINLQITSRE